MAGKPLSLTTPLTQRRARLGVSRAAFSQLVTIDVFRLGRIERGSHRATAEEMARINSALKMLEQAHGDIRDVLRAEAIPA